jgi:hypothetical protein
MKWEKCQLSIEVNNHLGYLYMKFCESWDKEKIEPKSLSLKQHVDLSNVYISYDVLNDSYARNVRKFIYNVPFDSNKEIINDQNNLPLSNVYHTNQSLILNCFENSSIDPNDWVWEKFSYCLWRLAPKTLNAFLGSPIPNLITLLEKTIRSKEYFGNIAYENLKKGTWVIQRIQKGQNVGIHSDKAYGRVISFIYYLTPDDWKKSDGGGLCMLNPYKKEFQRINPDFNSLIMWKSDDDNFKELHHVETVVADNDKPRIALVGFFNI